MMTERESFLAERSTGVGGSDIASVLSVGYGCALRLYREKRGEVPDYPRNETGIMELGKILEPHIADKFKAYTGAEVEVVGVTRDPEHPEFLVHADRLARYPQHSGQVFREWGVVEIKALGPRQFSEMKRSGLIEDYILQLQWGMAICQRPWGVFVVGNRDTWEMEYWDHFIDIELCAFVQVRAAEFWQRVKSGNPPDRLDPDDKRCQRCVYRRSCQGNALISIDIKDVENDEAMRPMIAEYHERRQMFTEAEELLEVTKEEIRVAMGDRGAVTSGESKVYFRPQVTRRWAAERLAKAYAAAAGKSPAEVDKEFKDESVSRPLRIYV